MAQTEWKYADNDPAAVAVLRERFTDSARQQQLIHYSDLVEGVEFALPTRREPYQIDTSEWVGFDRHLIGDYLGYLSSESYRAHGFMISAIAVSKADGTPSKQFFAWARELGLLKKRGQDAALAFWTEQMNRAFDHFKND